LNRTRGISYLCFGAALFIFLYASVDTIELVGEAPGSLTNERALEKAEGRGFWPILANFRMNQHIGYQPRINESHLIRYVGVAYLGNILIMALFLISGILLRTSFFERIVSPQAR